MSAAGNDSAPHVQRLLEHMTWADRRILALLDANPAAQQGDAARLFAHLLAAERVWLLRLTGADASAQPIWPALSLAELHELAAANAAEYARFLADLTNDALRTEVAYTNSAGTAFRTAVEDVLLHVAMHGSYHRGQIAAAARREGAAPVNTDYIAFVREGGAAGGDPVPAGIGVANAGNGAVR